MQGLRYLSSPVVVAPETLEVTVMACADIREVIKEAIGITYTNLTIGFFFNDVLVTVRVDSDPELIYRDYMRALRGYILKSVGPYPKLLLSQAELDSDARIEAENENRYREQEAVLEAEDRIKQAALAAKLLNAPEIELSDPEAWRRFEADNTDAHGKAVLRCAEDWARLMQLEMAKWDLESVEEVAMSCYDQSESGISGSMQGQAVQLLRLCWRHGEELKEWYANLWR